MNPKIAWLCAGLVLFGLLASGQMAAEANATVISDSVIGADHPAISAGTACIDCHALNIDATTTATEQWLHGAYAAYAEGEGVMPAADVKQAIVDLMGGRAVNKTCAIATCVNNQPLSTTAEFALYPQRMTLHGWQGRGTTKRRHLRHNPRASISWHREFSGVDQTVCVQFSGGVALIEGDDPRFDRIVRTCTPVAERARSMRMTPDAFIAMLSRQMVVSEMVVEEALLTSAALRQQGYRPWQRWRRVAVPDEGLPAATDPQR